MEGERTDEFPCHWVLERRTGGVYWAVFLYATAGGSMEEVFSEKGSIPYCPCCASRLYPDGSWSPMPGVPLREPLG